MLRVIVTTPQYGMPIESLLCMTEEGALTKFSVYVADWDIVHTPHVDYWQAAKRRVEGRRGEAAEAMRVVLLRHATHWGVCLALHTLGLHLVDDLWHDPTPLQAEPAAQSSAPKETLPPPPPIRARL